MTAETVAKITAIVKEVQLAADAVFSILESAGVGGHLNDSQEHALFDSFSNLAGVALKGYSDAAGVPITPESVLALLPDQTPLPKPKPEVTASSTIETPIDVLPAKSA